MGITRGDLKQKLFNFFDQLQYIRPTFSLIWRASKRWTAAWFVLLIIQGIMPPSTIYVTGWLIDALAMALGGGIARDNTQTVLVPGLLIGGLLLMSQLIGRLLVWVRAGQSEYLQDHLSNLIQQKATQLDLAFYENPAQQDFLHQAKQDLKTRPLALLENSGLFIQNTITLIAVIALIIPFGWWIPIVLIVGGLPGIFILLRHNRIRHEFWEQTTEKRRWTYYFDQIMMHERIAAELRLFDLGPFFIDSYTKLRHTLRDENLRLARNQTFAQLGAVLLAALVTAGIMIWIIYRALLGAFSIGDLVLFYQSINRGQSILGQFMNSAGQIYSHTLFLSNLFDLLELEPKIQGPEKPHPAPIKLNHEIRFSNVSFRYPGSERLVLKDFNFTIPADRITAIVGTNGAGKTTLIKLICRFYDPDEGMITFDGIDIRQLKVDKLRHMLTVMFQFPIPFFSTVAQNIEMGDLAVKRPKDEMERIAMQAGAHEFIEKLPNGYETMLGKVFAEGSELSGGQWQRLALARSFWRKAPIMILDEPTSAMDSWAEIDWFDRFRELATGKTALLITHRFTTAKKADIIHVMEDGAIIESGSHQELLAIDGRYAASWGAQIEQSRST